MRSSRAWVIDVFANTMSSWACSSVVDHWKVSALKLRYLIACPGLGQNWFFVQEDTIFQREGKKIITDLNLAEVRGTVDF
jgi:hypothetical protein